MSNSGNNNNNIITDYYFASEVAIYVVLITKNVVTILNKLCEYPSKKWIIISTNS